jgi:hypothetical protein
MRRTSTFAIALLAALCACTGASASASAELPEYMFCGKAPKVERQYLGHYTTATCSSESKVETGGEYEIEKGLGKKATFTARSGPLTLATTGVSVEMECKTSTAAGEFTGSKAARAVIIKASGCEWNGTKCNSAGLTTGHIITSALAGEFGYLAGKGSDSPVVGLRLNEESTPYVTEFTCEGVEVRTQGPIFTEVGGDVNTLASEPTYTFRQSGGVQQYTSFEGGGMPDGDWHWEFNVGKGWEPEGGTPSGLEAAVVAKTELLEIKA